MDCRRVKRKKSPEQNLRNLSRPVNATKKQVSIIADTTCTTINQPGSRFNPIDTVKLTIEK